MRHPSSPPFDGKRGLFSFDEAEPDLSILPTAARRALDVVGEKLSLVAWRSLPREDREELVGAGAATSVDARAVREIIGRASPKAIPIRPEPEPPSDQPPATLLAALGAARSLSPSVWAALRPLDRYALCKVAAKGPSPRLDRAWKEIVETLPLSSHLGARGEARMVDIAAKAISARRAVASARVRMDSSTFARLAAHDTPKGDVLAAARIAGIQAAKRTPDLIPLCHRVALTSVEIEFTLEPDPCALSIRAAAEALDRTGVEMEALVAASTAALTVYDMLKGLDHFMTITEIGLLEKSGGRSGHLRRDGT